MSDVWTDTGTDEVVVSLQDETLLLGGDPAAVESYLARCGRPPDMPCESPGSTAVRSQTRRAGSPG